MWGEGCYDGGNGYTRIYIANEITLMSFLEPLWVYQGFQSTKLRLKDCLWQYSICLRTLDIVFQFNGLLLRYELYFAYVCVDFCLSLLLVAFDLSNIQHCTVQEN